MRKLLLTITIALFGLSPAIAYADQQLIIPVQQSAPMTPGSDGMDGVKVLAIGAGIVIGAAIFSTALSFRGATLLGAVAGGLVGSWWYGDRSDVAPLAPRKKTP
jgi:hypothetical protein